MSSESDDDFSYTNSASVLKALKKKDISISEDNDTSIDCALTFTDSPIVFRNIKKNRPKSKDSLIVTKCDDNNKNIEYITVEDITESADCIAVSDGETDKSLNIVTVIDSFLQKGKRKRGKTLTKQNNNRKTTVKARRSKRLAEHLRPAPSVSYGKVHVVSDTEESNDADDVNFEVTVKVWWKSQYIEKFTIRRFDKFDVIFKHFAEKESVSEDRLLFTIHGRILTISDTPASLSVNAASIIEGGVLSEEVTTTVRPANADKVELKVQMKDRKHPLKMYLRLTDSMNILMYQCAEQLNVPSSALKFYFDGDLIKPTDTAESLELEGGECIDCVRK